MPYKAYNFESISPSFQTDENLIYYNKRSKLEFALAARKDCEYRNVE